MYFWLNYCDENYHVQRIPIAVKNINHLFHLASEIIEADTLHLFLLSGGTRIDDSEYLESLENGTKLIVCKEDQIQKLGHLENSASASRHRHRHRHSNMNIEFLLL